MAHLEHCSTDLNWRCPLAFPTDLPKCYRVIGNGVPDIRIYPEAASQSFTLWEPVNLASGKVQRIAAISTSITSTDGVVGIALVKASGTTNTNIPVMLARSIELRLPVTHGTTSSAVTAVTNVGTSYCISHTGTAGYYAYQISVTSNPVVIPSEIAADYAVGTVSGYAWCRFIANAIQVP